jgi:hypothetical protein
VQAKQDSSTAASGSSLLARSIEAFYRNLPELLKQHDGKWVAYHGDEWVGAGRTETELFQKCLERGFKDDEFIVLFADAAARWDREEIDLPLNP